MSLLAHLAAASHRRESTLLRRFPRAETELAALQTAGFVETHSLKKDAEAWRITAAGRSELQRARVRAESKARAA